MSSASGSVFDKQESAEGVSDPNGTVINPVQLEQLLDILKMTDQPLDHVNQTFNQTFAQPDRFRIGLVLSMMIEDQLLGCLERLLGFYILYSMYPHMGASPNPWLSLVLNRLDESKEMVERKFISQFILPTPVNDLSQKSAKSYADSAEIDEPFDLPNIEVHRQRHQEACPELPAFRMSLHPTILDNETAWSASNQTDNDNGQDKATSWISVDPSECRLNAELFQLHGIQPSWIRPNPPLLEPTYQELFWLHPPILHEPLWDYTLSSRRSRVQVSKWVKEGLVEVLCEAKQTAILQALEEEPKLAFHLTVTPDNFPGLVDNNPKIATELILKMMTCSSTYDYFTSLIKMPMSLHSMEVVNELAMKALVPQEVIQMFISNGIVYCDGIQDKTSQQRIVRLFSVFLQMLLKNDIIDVSLDPLIEIQHFCINHGKIRETATLFKALKTAQQNLASGGGQTGGGSSQGGVSSQKEGSV